MAILRRRVEREDEDLVHLYLTDIGQYPLLTKEDEVRLAQQIEQGNTAREELLSSGTALTPTTKSELHRTARAGEDAQRTFVQSNLRLVVSIATKYQSSGVPLLDLIQEGNLGLIHAVDKFDWRKGFKFSTYATWWIRQAVSRSIANTARTIRLPVHADDRRVLLQRMRGDLEAKFGRSPTRAELAEALDIPEVKVVEVMRFTAGTLSLSEPLGDDSAAEFGDLVEDHSQPSPCDAAVLALLPLEVSTMLGALDEREQLILSLRYGLDRREPLTLQEVGERLDLSRERIRQIEAKAMSKLRHPANSDSARSLLDA
jgi:RNA polymerase sigma factor (sigma-70 family)